MVTFKTNIARFHTFPPETAITNPCLFTKFIIFLILALKYSFCNSKINVGFFRHLKFEKEYDYFRYWARSTTFPTRKLLDFCDHPDDCVIFP